jgi:DNA-binding HxlR family transcriptional regulator
MIAIAAPPICSARIGLRLLRPGLNRAILLEAGRSRLMGVSDLCARLMLESDTTLREQLDELERVDVIERRRDDVRHSAGQYRLTAAGAGLVEVMALTGAWLKSRPGQPLNPESDAAWRAFAALADGWESALIHHLLLRPSSRAELTETVPLSKEKLKRMLRRMKGAGLLKSLEQDAPAPRYAVTVWARRAIAVLAAIVYWERAYLSSTAESVAASDGTIALLASLPLIRPPEDASGVCVFTIEVETDRPSPRAAAVWASLAEGRVRACHGGKPRVPPDAWVRGGVAAWLEALVNDRRADLHVGGNLSLAESALHGLHKELFKVSPFTG